MDDHLLNNFWTSFKNFDDITVFEEKSNYLLESWTKQIYTDKEFTQLFKIYSREYMNYIMNHTHLSYLLKLYQLLIVSLYSNLNKYSKHIPTIIYLNIYCLYTYQKKDKNMVLVSTTGWSEFDTYILACKYLNNDSMQFIEYSKYLLPPMDLFVLTQLLYTRKDAIITYDHIDYYDNIRFFFLIGYQMVIYLNMNFKDSRQISPYLKNALDTLIIVKNKKSPEFIKNCFYILNSFFYILCLDENFKEIKSEIEQNIESLPKKTNSEEINLYLNSIHNISNECCYYDIALGSFVIIGALTSLYGLSTKI